MEVSLAAEGVTIKGEKKAEKEVKGKDEYRLERTYGAFRRHISLPCQVDVDKATASFKKGVLTVTLPKSGQAPKAKTIAIKS